MQEIRERLMAEEQLEERQWIDSKKEQRKKRGKHRKSEVNNTVLHSDVKRLSLPATLNVSSLTTYNITVYTFIWIDEIVTFSFVERYHNREGNSGKADMGI